MTDLVRKKGGARAGVGAKLKYGCKTVTMRVPVNMVDEIQAFILKKKNIEPKYKPEPQIEGQVTFEEQIAAAEKQKGEDYNDPVL
jgi:hypothetical protein